MLWEVTDYRRADPVRHYEAEKINSKIMMVVIELIMFLQS